MREQNIYTYILVPAVFVQRDLLAASLDRPCGTEYLPIKRENNGMIADQIVNLHYRCLLSDTIGFIFFR